MKILNLKLNHQRSCDIGLIKVYVYIKLLKRMMIFNFFKAPNFKN